MAKRFRMSEEQVRCPEIREALFEYLARELGSARSELVARHLRKCQECQRAAAEIQSTLDVLRADSQELKARPVRLSDERRRRIRWSLLHPVLDWILAHHVIVSLLAVVIILLTAALCLKSIRVFWTPDDMGTEVNVGPLPGYTPDGTGVPEDGK